MTQPISTTTPQTTLVIAVNHSLIIARYFEQFETLSQAEDWDAIIALGINAIESTQQARRPKDEAKICAQLTTTLFNKGQYAQALPYAQQCGELFQTLQDQPMIIRSLYLKSAIARGLAQKEVTESSQQAMFICAIAQAEQAETQYKSNHINNVNLLGKIHFNLGAAHADNPKGDLEKAATSYEKALECFKKENATYDIIRVSIRLGKVYLLNKNYTASQEVIDKVRPQITGERLAMQTDYLEAKLKLAVKDLDGATRVARNGLARAEKLGAKEDESRLQNILEHHR